MERTGMTTRCYIGVRDPEQPRTVHLRYIHSDGDSAWTVRAFRQIWATTAQRNTGRLIALLLAYDWYDLNADTTTAGKPIPDGQPVPGVGRRLTFIGINTGTVLSPDPAALVVALEATGDLDAQWIYLIDPTNDTIAIHTTGGALVGNEPLAS
jgi:hypothetical protein